MLIYILHIYMFYKLSFVLNKKVYQIFLIFQI